VLLYFYYTCISGKVKRLGAKMGKNVFSYRISKDRKVFISWNGKPVTVLSGNKAESFVESVTGAGEDAQLIMAKATGNFKRGNEHNKSRG